jgi:hypothetical protein
VAVFPSLKGLGKVLRAAANNADEAPGRLSGRLADLDKKIDRLRRAIAQVDDEGLIEQLRHAKQEREQVAGELAQAGRFTTPADVEAEAERVVAKVWGLADALADANPATLRELLAELVYRIDCRFDKIRTPGDRTRCPLIEGWVELRDFPGFGLSGGVRYQQFRK